VKLRTTAALLALAFPTRAFAVVEGPCDAGEVSQTQLACPAAIVDASADAMRSEAGSEMEGVITNGCGCEITGAAGPAVAWMTFISAISLGFIRRRKK
jgi:MYXO-CTERM domain-containing protein